MSSMSLNDVEEYFFAQYGTLPIISTFQRQVYEQTLLIPKGYVSTYGSIASAIGCGSARAVGGALRRNPYDPIVPCHRVLRADLSIGGFRGEQGPSSTACLEKIALLSNEGIQWNVPMIRDSKIELNHSLRAHPSHLITW